MEGLKETAEFSLHRVHFIVQSGVVDAKDAFGSGRGGSERQSTLLFSGMTRITSVVSGERLPE